MRGVVLVSGGMDSLVTAAIAARDCSDIFFLHVNYGQRTEQREMMAFQKIREFYQPVNSLICDLAYLKQIGSSSLVDYTIPLDSEIKEGQIPNTYVPFRNAHLLAIAASWAETVAADRIYIGAVEEDSSGYPDCREAFLIAFNKAINQGTKDLTELKIVAPLLHLSKKDIILQGMDLKAPFEYSWSCYQENEIACGKCVSCLLRLKAFKDAGIKDPIPYR